MPKEDPALTVELVYFDGCPNADRARSNIMEAFREIGREAQWKEWDVLEDDTPSQYRSYPSPTVLINGRDVSGGTTGTIGISCRAEGAPTTDQIVRLLPSSMIRSGSMRYDDGPELEEYWKTLDSALPRFTPEEQRAAIAVYRELGKGYPITFLEVARSLGVSENEAKERLDRPALKAFSYVERGEILGFGGLAVRPMTHRFKVGGRQLWTWCAWDSLFIPQILGEKAIVESPDPVTTRMIRLTVSATGYQDADPGSPVVSFTLPDPKGLGSSSENVMAAFCHFVFFFGSEESGSRWTSQHPGTFLYSLDQAFELARRLIARVFPIAMSGSLST